MALIIVLAIVFIAIALLMVVKQRMRIMLVISRNGIIFCMIFWWFKVLRKYSFLELVDMIIDRPDRKEAEHHLVRLKDLINKYELTSLTIRGRIGIKDDAASTAILCGLLRNFAQTFCSLRIKDAKKLISIHPDFTKGIFWVYLEGILNIYPGKIISMIIKLWFRRKFRNGTSD